MNAENPAASEIQGQKTVLHVGCGPKMKETLHPTFHGPEWRELRLDINPGVAPDIVASITDLSLVDTDSVDAVWSSHNIEHLYPHEVPLALKEFFRVLKPGGFLLITMPDLQEVARLIVEDKLEDTAYVAPAGPISPIDILYGFRPAIAQGNVFMAHRTGFTSTSLKNHLYRAGFRQGKVWAESFAIWAIMKK